MPVRVQVPSEARKHCIALKRCNVFLVQEVLSLRSKRIFDPVSIVLLHLAADNLHSTVHHVVLLCERLVSNDNRCRKPPFREHALT